MLRPVLIGIVVLSACLHALGMARSDLPAQDGLKFIRVARQFHDRPWPEVVRGTDQHPLYPALIALAEPVVGRFVSSPPDAWRIAAQGVSAAASLLLLIPLHGMARHLFDRRAADLAVFLWVVLPLPGMVGHDTLSDPTALLAFACCWRAGQVVLSAPNPRAVAACGLAAGIGYLSRPEVILAPLVIALTGVAMSLRRPFASQGIHRHAGVIAASLIVVGGYALVKGEVSEKLALRRAVALPPSAAGIAPTNRLPAGLDGPGWDFAPKEESGRTARITPIAAVVRVVGALGEDLAGVAALLAVVGVWRGRRADGSRAAALASLVYLVAFGLVLVRHATVAGYLSARHTLTLAVVVIPWAGAGLSRLAVRFAAGRRWLSMGIIAALIAVAIGVQLKGGHPSRWGHRQAGAWLARHATADQALLDTRGWAAFVADRPAYTPWQFGPALQDPSLAYLVIGADELVAASPRSRSLSKLLEVAGTPVASFPERRGGSSADILVYRVRAPASWEGLTP